MVGRSLLSAADMRRLLLGREMKYSLLVRPPFENPNLIELNYFLTSFHIYIRGEEDAFLRRFPASFHARQLLVCSVIDS